MTGSAQPSTSKKQLRLQHRAARRALTPHQQHLAARRLAAAFSQHPIFLRSSHIAFYQAADGEIDPRYLLQHALDAGRHCYLPCISPTFTRPRPNRLLFARHKDPDRLAVGRYGILEPDWQRTGTIHPAALHLVLMPLVAFDAQGHRLGMGKGYYDRTFEFLLGTPVWRRPVLIGLAHECQRVDRLVTDDWDLPLTGIMTDQRFYACDNGRQGGKIDGSA